MAFKNYFFGAYRSEIRDLLRRRFTLLDKVRYYKKKINVHLDKIKKIESETLVNVEKELEKFLRLAGNTSTQKMKGEGF